MNRIALDELKQQIPLLEYLQAHAWQQAKPIGFGRLLGLCPLHERAEAAVRSTRRAPTPIPR